MSLVCFLMPTTVLFANEIAKKLFLAKHSMVERSEFSNEDLKLLQGKKTVL